MSFRRLAGPLAVSFAVLAYAVLGSSAAAAATVPTSNRWKLGVNYKVLSSPLPTSAAAGKVQVIEFFYLACPFCHALEPHMLAWRKRKPAYVQFVRVPVMWRSLQRADARLFYTLEALNRDDLVETAFDTIHRLEVAAGGNENVLIGNTEAQTLALQEAFAEHHGISAAAFANAYNSFYVNTELQQATQLGQSYEVWSTPTIIIDGRFKTQPSYFPHRDGSSARGSGDKRMIKLITFLTEWVHAHPKAS